MIGTPFDAHAAPLEALAAVVAVRASNLLKRNAQLKRDARALDVETRELEKLLRILMTRENDAGEKLLRVHENTSKLPP